jgi:dihydroorotate dehydrogenase electron transfer subunit
MTLHSCVSSPAVTHRAIRILENVAIARDTFRLRLGDAALAQAIRPGQFVMIRPALDDATDPLLGRPLALYDVVRNLSGTPEAFDVVYLVVGRGTAALARRRPGEQVAVWGPLGNGFGPRPNGPVLFVAGGIGQTPFLALGREWQGPEHADGTSSGRVASERITARSAYSAIQLGLAAASTDRPAASLSGACSMTLLYGVRTAALLAGVDDFRHAGFDVELATDDGTAGHHGFVTELLARRLASGERPAKIVGCGPPAMLSTLAELAMTYRIPCDVSLENCMACGFGACFSCVASIRQDDGSFDLRRICVEGPVVGAERIDWTQIAR